VNASPAALVTGVSSGIGKAIAERLLEQGWTVIGVSRRRPDLSESARFSWLGADLTDSSGISKVVSRVQRVTAIVHAAGLLRSAPLGGLSVEDGRQMWNLHVEAPTRLVNGLVDKLSDGGRIVLIGSRTMSGVAGKSQYSATKSALVGLTRSWAMELSSRGITVNVVAPGPTDTAMLNDPGRAHTPPKKPALGRFVEPAEVAGLTAFLLGPDGRSITGQQLVICAGASL
jgi:3-oxoacyl-[acyl-carrier protein] reductase